MLHYPSAIYSPRFPVPAYPPKHLREHPRVPNFASPKARMRLPEPIKITIPVEKKEGKTMETFSHQVRTLKVFRNIHEWAHGTSLVSCERCHKLQLSRCHPRS